MTKVLQSAASSSKSQKPNAPRSTANTATIRTWLQACTSSWTTPLTEVDRPKKLEKILKYRAKCVDKAISLLWSSLKMPDNWSLVAVGGYGRAELFPYSDVDVLILIHQPPDTTQTAQLEQFCSACWDIGLEVGHSVRTLTECLAESDKDITIQTALLESRLITGNKRIFSEFKVEFFQHLNPKNFFRKKVLELRQRHTRYQDSPYNLEPNCKESPGGLRDLHVIQWITQAAQLGGDWFEMACNGLITPQEAARLHKSEWTLKKIRYQLHVTANRREDRLIFDIQTRLAESLGFQATKTKRSSEQFMQTYYLAAKPVLQLNTILLQNIEHSIFGQDVHPVPLDDEFQISDGLLDLRHDDVFANNPSAMLRAFIVVQQNRLLKGMSTRMLRQLWHQRVRINHTFRKNPTNKILFLDIFKQPSGILHALRRMNETSILSRYLPVFSPIVGQMQHDLFHAYTVDQHILMVIRNLRRFSMAEHAHEYPYCSQLMANFDESWLLYIAALFHDVAKGRGGDHSQLGEIDARKFCEDHQLDEEDADLVCFLVKHHLTMSHTAQKKDLSDPLIIEEFSNLVQTPRRLTALYLLTVADIRGTSPKVWNAWKGKLLEDLYKLTLKQLDGSPPSRRQMLQEQKNEARRILRLYALADEVETKLWDTLPVSYFLRLQASEIAWHTRHLYWRPENPDPIVKARLSPLGEGMEILVYTRDEDDLFARICGYLNHKNFNILDAKIHTSSNSWALDSFLIQPNEDSEFYREIISQIEAELQETLNKKTELPPPCFGRISRQSKHFPIQPRVELRPDDKGNQYLLSISTTDRTGLLYCIARVLAKYHISIQTAKVMTLGERVEDVFLIYGEALSSQKLQIQLETELLDTMEF